MKQTWFCTCGTLHILRERTDGVMLYDAAVSVDERRMCPHLEEQAELVREVLADAKIDMERVVEARGQSNLHRH